ncbi:DUF317 domain-containing protein [Streptomyces sp. NPDC003077]|uniref:DUF317 domain-containing protein n=1 Tax=Streptomyces sp. NPDC003077 TaxID=3154443 RepID=UPI0033BEBA56
MELTSPDHQASVVLDPQHPMGEWWRVLGRPDGGPAWWASFGEKTPAEVLAGLTDALTAPAPEDPPEVWAVLAERGWTCTEQADGSELAVSPDELAHLTHGKRFPDDPYPPWRIKVIEAPWARGPFWEAQLHHTTPAHLLSALGAALASPEPVQRGMHDRTAYSAHRNESPLTPEQVVEAHTRRLDAARARARAARRAQKFSAQRTPVPDRPVPVSTARGR